MKNLLLNIYDKMFESYGPQRWWPGDTPWEICVGAVLTQNTNWNNVEKAIANLKRADFLCPSKIASIPREELENAIRPSGFFRLKADRLLAVTEWWLKNTRDSRLAKDKPLDFWRDSLLEVKGVGPETADSILLYSFDMPTFVIDAYTKRIMARHAGTAPEIDYHKLQDIFMRNLPRETAFFNEFHALFVQTAKLACKKKECLPECPLGNTFS